MTGRDIVEDTIDRLRRREEAGRWLITAALSVLIHLALLLLLASPMLDPSRALEKEPEEIVVPLKLDSQPPPDPPRQEPQPQPRPQAPEPEPEPPEEEAQEQEPPPEEQDLIGWQSRGEEPGRQDRPPGPEAEIHAPPEPSNERGSALEPTEVEEAPPGPDELPDEPGQKDPEERAGPAEEPPETVEETPVDEQEDPDEQPPPADPESVPTKELPKGELFPEAEETPSREPDAPRTQSPEEREPEPEPLPLPTPRKRRPSNEPNRGGVMERLPGFDAEIQGGYFNQNLKFDSKDYPWSDYATKLYFAVYRAWLRELHARVRRFERDQMLHELRNLDGRVAIHFTIHRDGNVTGLDVRDPSRLPALDEASSAALRRAVIPPLPDDFPRDQEGVTFGFELRGFTSAQQLARQLEWSRAKGEF